MGSAATAPAPEAPAAESTGGGACISLGQQILVDCGNERSTVESIYPIASTTPASPQQVQQAVTALQAAHLPSAACCTASGNFNTAQCQCDTTLAAVLPSAGIEVTGLKSQLTMLGQACATPFTTLSC